MDADIASSVPQSPTPLVKTGSMEWFGGTMRPEFQIILVMLVGLGLLTTMLLVLIPAELRSLTLVGQSQSAPVTTDTDSAVNPGAEATACAPRTDWAMYPIQPNDSLTELSQRTGVSMMMIANSNCLQPATLESSSTLYLPAVPSR